MITRNSNTLVSVCSISWAPVDDVLSISTGYNEFHKVLTFAQGKNWQSVYMTPGSGEFTEKEKEKDNDAGQLIEQSCKFAYPGEDEKNSAELDAIQARPVVVKIDFSNGLSKIMGDIDNPAKLSRSLQHASKASGSQMEFSCLSSDRCFWLSLF